MLKSNIPQNAPLHNGLSTSQRFGLATEKWVLAQLHQAGHQADLVRDFFQSFDILIDGVLPAEVKASRPHLHRARRTTTGGIWRQRWQWNIQRGLDPRTDHILVLLAVDADGATWPYILKSAWLNGRGHHLAITSHPSHYTGWMASSLNAWHHVAELVEVRRRLNQYTLPLFNPERQVA